MEVGREGMLDTGIDTSIDLMDGDDDVEADEEPLKDLAAAMPDMSSWLVCRAEVASWSRSSLE